MLKDEGQPPVVSSNPLDPAEGLKGVALLAYHLKRLKLEKEKRELEEAKNAPLIDPNTSNAKVEKKTF